MLRIATYSSDRKIHFQYIVQVPKDVSKPVKSSQKAIVGDVAGLNTATAGYRSDLASAARARYGKLYKDIQVKKGLVAKSVAKRGRK